MIIGDVVLLAESRALPAGEGTVPDLLSVIEAAVSAGVHTVIVRDKHRPRAERADLCRGTARILDHVGGVVIAAEDRLPGPAARLPADGIHLASAATWTPEDLAELADVGLGVSQSCHSAGEAAAAVARGATFVTASPVFPTSSKPGYGPALGLDGLRELVSTSGAVTVALGGIATAEQRLACRGAGAAAVAVMGAIVGAADPAAAARAVVPDPDRPDPDTTEEPAP